MHQFEKLYLAYRKLAKNYQRELDFYYHVITAMHQTMQQVIKSFAKEFKNREKKKEGINAILDIYELNILHCFWAHYNTLKSGITLASYSNLRTIYETTLRIYVNECYPDVAEATCNYNLKNDLAAHCFP